jgi:hypothetical protein
MDRFTKFLLVVIAIATSAIAFKMWMPEANAQGFLSSAPTIGDFQDTKDPEGRRKLARRIPIIRVQGGQISYLP